MRRSLVLLSVAALSAAGLSLAPSGPASAAPAEQSRADQVAAYWTSERVQAAQPRDLAVDDRGFGYRRTSDGTLVPYGHGTPAQATQLRATPTGSSSGSPAPQGKPTGSGDTTGPTVTGMSPASGTTIGGSATFSATVVDTSGVRGVTVVIVYPDGVRTSSFAASTSSDTWSVTISGFSNGGWQWYVVARDGTKGSGNSTTTDPSAFTVDTGTTPPPPPDGGSGDVVANAEWASGGTVQTAAGRIYFEMPNQRRAKTWSGYVCSGTVVTDTADDSSVILTAAHCVYDDVNKAFARNVLFIPNQAANGTRTDTDCTNDLYGCWAPEYGVVDINWTTTTFPNNIPWDYAYYVVPATGAHAGNGDGGSLESVVGSLPPSFDAPDVDVPDSNDDRTTALGYSYSDDPNFMYCAEDMTTEGTANWWLPSCGLSGGSSGGPWVQSMGTNGSGPVISVNSWGYTDRPGMAGPKLSGTSAESLFTAAHTATPTPTDRGVIVD